MLPIILAAAMALAGQAVQDAAGSPPRPPCADPEHRQFDFWIGRWDVTETGKTEVAAQSLIEKVYSGCGIRENWIPEDHAEGGSLNIYVPAERAWRQTWIDSAGTRGDFTGGWNGQAMVLSGPWPTPKRPDRLVRITWTPAADGTVRQAGEASFDGGKSWRPSFDLTYRKAKAARSSRLRP